ncbi:MAG: hypothetical protein ACYC2K_01840 [Gemmatimonadales bacterium]
MTVLARLRRARRSLIASGLTSAAFWAIAVAAPIYLVFGSRPLAILAAAGAVAATLWHRRGVFDISRVALWLEEQLPELQYTLVTALDPDAAAVRAELESKIAAIDLERAAHRASVRSIGRPLLAAAFAIIASLGLRRAMESRGAADVEVSTESESAPSASQPIRIAVMVTPPAHTRLPVQRLSDPVRVEGVVGSRVQIEGATQALGLEGLIGTRPLAVSQTSKGWRAELTLPNAPTVVRFRHAERERLILLEPRQDSLPVVRLDLPERDTLLQRATGILPLAASFRDDFGLAETWWELVVSRGDGENFEFRTVTLDRASVKGARTTTRSLALALDSLTLSAGDVILLRAVARDGNTIPNPGIAGSDPRTIRIAATRGDDSLDIELLPPAEPLANLLSQRMLILLTEALQQKRPRLTRPDVVAEATRIGRDQTSLRRQVGDLVFSRLEDLGASGEHSHDDGHDHSAMNPEELLRAAESANRQASGEALDFAAGESPVIAVNRPLLEAYHAMWDAARELNVGEPKAALPHMYAALDAIQRARLADRIYLRGRTRPVVVDLEKVRLVGKRDGIAPGARTPQPSLDPAVRQIAARFDAALALLARDRTAAVDSLLLLRADLLAEHPRMAAPLGLAIDTLRTDRDATAALARARRAIGNPPSARSGLRSWSTSP